MASKGRRSVPLTGEPQCILGLDRALVGEHLIRLALTAKHFGHQHASDTARDYVIPNLTAEERSANPECAFVLDLLTRSVDEVVPEEDAITFARADTWTDD
jgi:hypothetical protein